MRKMWKKLSAIFMMVVLVMAMVMPAMAAATNTTPIKGEKPTKEDQGTVEINGLTAEDEVYFYKIVKANYDDSGFVGYEAVKDSTISLFNDDGAAIYPDADQIAALALDTNGLDVVGPIKAADDKVKQALEVGEWLVIVKPVDATTVYNPLVASVYYTGAGGKTITSGVVSVDDTYTITSSSSYVKKSTTDLEKKITGGKYKDIEDKGIKDKDRDLADAKGKGDDLAVGDTIDFQIDSVIPAYSAEYKNLKFDVSDTMDKGLDLNQDSITLTVGGASVDEANYTLTKEDHEFKISFTEEYLRSLAAATEEQRKVLVTYSGTLNADATTNFDANKNTATIEFTNKPGENQDAEKITKKTYQYTFEIDGNISGYDKSKEHRTHELIKTGEGGSVVDGQIIDDGWYEVETKSPLAGAKFKLSNTESGKEYEVETDDLGYMNFKQLDAGKYTLVETVAPQGYSLNSQVHDVEITAVYNPDGTLKSYTIMIDGKQTSTYEATYDSEGEKIVEVHEEAHESTEIKNTKLNNLPSTGGMGTYIFTFIGVALMVLGVIAYRRNSVLK